MSEELKPCPFCGGEAEWNIGKKGDDTPWRYIACGACEAMGPHVADWERRIQRGARLRDLTHQLIASYVSNHLVDPNAA